VNMNNKSLGNGLSALFGQNSFNNEAILNVSIDLIEPNPLQPRKIFNQEELNELASSIKQHGVIQPIILKQIDGGKYEIITGERRYRASKLAGLKTIPSIIKNKTEIESLEITLVENIQRVDLNPVEEAFSYKYLTSTCNYTHDQISEKTGKSRSHITNLIRILGMPYDVIEMLQSGNISIGHAKVLLSIDNQEDIIKYANLACKNELSVKKLTEMIKMDEEVITKSKNPIKYTDYEKSLIKSVKKKSKVQIKFQKSSNQSSITVKFVNEEDLNNIISSLNIDHE
jgi:ParB family chromosome partitioning protein